MTQKPPYRGSPCTRRRLLQGALGGAAGLTLWPWRVAHATAQPSGQLTVGVHVTLSPTWFDPAETPGIITPFMFLYALHDALVKPMPGNTLTPSLAESWSESPDGHTYEFLLRAGVTFHNGDPLTTEDVQFSFLRYKGTAAGEFKTRVRDVEIVDPRRIRFHLHEIWPDFMTFYGTPATGAGWIVPKTYVEKVGDDAFKQHPIGAGPYKFVSQEPGIGAICEANDKYWRKVPAVKRLVFTGVPEETTRVAMLKRQEADITFGLEAPWPRRSDATRPSRWSRCIRQACGLCILRTSGIPRPPGMTSGCVWPRIMRWTNRPLTK